jgi:hypothetical protein
MHSTMRLRRLVIATIVIATTVGLGSALLLTVSSGVALANPITIANQSMEGDLRASPGDWLAAGYHFSGSTTGATYSFVNAQVTFPVSCVSSGVTPSQSSLVVSLSGGPYTGQSGQWVPTGNQSSVLVYQGAIQVPDLCSGGKVSLAKGGSFTADVQSSDTTHSISLQWHYRDPNAKGQGNIDCASTSPGNNTTAGVGACSASWSATKSVVPDSMSSSTPTPTPPPPPTPTPPPPPAPCGSSNTTVNATPPGSGPFLGPLGHSTTLPTTTGTVQDYLNSCSPTGSQITPTVSETISNICAYVGPVDVAPQNQFSVALYTDASGMPGTVIASSAVGTLTADSWNCLPMSASLAANTSYWLLFWSNSTLGSSGPAGTFLCPDNAASGANDNLCYTHAPGGALVGAFWNPAALTTFPNWTNPLSAGGAWVLGDWQFSLVAVVTP